MFGKSKLKQQNDILHEQVELLQNALGEALRENKRLEEKTKNLFTYDDAIEILNARLDYMEERYNEVKGSGLIEVTRRYYYQKDELAKIIWVLIEKGRQKDEKITKDTFKKLVV